MSEFVEVMTRYASEREGADLREGVDIDLLVSVYAALRTADAPLEAAAAREIGSLAARVPVSERDSERHVHEIATQLPRSELARAAASSRRQRDRPGT